VEEEDGAEEERLPSDASQQAGERPACQWKRPKRRRRTSAKKRTQEHLSEIYGCEQAAPAAILHRRQITTSEGYVEAQYLVRWRLEKGTEEYIRQWEARGFELESATAIQGDGGQHSIQWADSWQAEAALRECCADMLDEFLREWQEVQQRGPARQERPRGGKSDKDITGRRGWRQPHLVHPTRTRISKQVVNPDTQIRATRKHELLIGIKPGQDKQGRTASSGSML
jgi:hypothetical protein